MKTTAVALVCLLAAGCASKTAPRGSAATALSSVSPAVSSGESNPPAGASESPPSSSPASPSSSAAPVTVQANTVAAADEAAALLAAVQLPPRAHEVAPAPEVGSPWLVERTQSWQVPMGFDVALAWEKSHPPTGTESTGGGTGSGPGPTDRNVDLDFAPTTSSPAWSDPRLSIDVVSGTATVSYLHIYAAAGAIDPTPYPDEVAEPRVRVTVAAGCPQSNSKGDGEVNQGVDLATLMVPVAEPTAGLLCEYTGNFSGTEDTWNRLIKAIPLDADLAAKIAHEIAQVPLGHVDGLPTSCAPGGFRPVPVLALSYADRPDVDVWGTSGACWIANGRILLTGEDLAASVENLVGGSTTVAQ